MTFKWPWKRSKRSKAVTAQPPDLKPVPQDHCWHDHASRLRGSIEQEQCCNCGQFRYYYDVLAGHGSYAPANQLFDRDFGKCLSVEYYQAMREWRRRNKNL